MRSEENVLVQNIQEGEKKEFAGDVAKAMNGSQHQQPSSTLGNGVLLVQLAWANVFVGEYLKRFLVRHSRKPDQIG